MSRWRVRLKKTTIYAGLPSVGFRVAAAPTHGLTEREPPLKALKECLDLRAARFAIALVTNGKKRQAY